MTALTNTAPVLDTGANPSFTTLLEGAANPAGDTVSSLLAGASDADGDALGIAITAVNGSLGTWQFSTDDGATWHTVLADLINSGTNELALLLGSSAKVRLLPFGDLHGSVEDGITLRAWDGASGAQGSYTTIAATGADTPYSVADDVAAIAVGDLNDAPVFEQCTGQIAMFLFARNSADAVLVQPDGKIVTAGFADGVPAIRQALGSGNADGAFADNGTMPVGVIGAPSTIAQQPDGKLLAGGQEAANLLSVVRILPQAVFDTFQLANLGGQSETAEALSIQADG